MLGRKRLGLCWKQSCEPGSAGASCGPESLVVLRESEAETYSPFGIWGQVPGLQLTYPKPFVSDFFCWVELVWTGLSAICSKKCPV